MKVWNKNGFRRAISIFVIAISNVAAAAPTLQEILDYYSVENFSGHVLVVRDTEVIVDKKFGLASYGEGRTFSETPKFYIGSVSKQFTATAILRLQDQGKLNVTQKVSEFLPEMPHASEITIHQLLNHTSGLFNYTDLDDFWSWMAQAHTKTPDEIIALIKDKSLDFTPGEKYSYSNTGYVVLGMMIQKITGQPWGVFLESEILNTLNMTYSGYLPGNDPSDTATGHTWNRDYQPVFQDHGNLSWAYAAGGLYSTVYDMLKWSRGLHEQNLLSAASYKSMTTPYLKKYGYGVISSKINQKTLISHGGGIPGATCHVLSIPEDKIHVIVLSNQSGHDMAFNFGDDLISFMAAEDFAIPEHMLDLPTSQEELTKYSGKYYSKDIDFEISIFNDSGKLYLQGKDQSAWKLLRASEEEFHLKVVKAKIQFKKDQEGMISGFTLFQNDKEHLFELQSAKSMNKKAISISQSTP